MNTQEFRDAVSREQLLSSARQERHLREMSDQLRALQAMQGQQLAMQQAQMLAQQMQAMLQQVLYETEQAVNQLAAWASEDPLAVAVRARLWMLGLQDGGIHPSLYAAYEHKKALTELGQRLDQLWNYGHGSNPDLAVKTVTAWRRHYELRAQLGDRNRDTLLQLEFNASDARGQSAAQKKRATVLLALGLTAVLGALAFIGMSFSKDSSSGFVVGGIALAVVATVSIGGSNTANSRARRLNEEAVETDQAASELGRSLAAWEAFRTAAEGGVLLERVMREHPRLQA